MMPVRQLRLLAGLEYGRTIPLADIDRIEIPQCTRLPHDVAVPEFAKSYTAQTGTAHQGSGLL
jgi:hypothetical protein